MRHGVHSHLGKSRCLVLGAGGFIGQSVLQSFKNSGIHVIGVSRPSFGGSSETNRVLDIFDGVGLRQLIKDIQPAVVVNATGHKPGITGVALREFYVHSTEILLNAIAAEQPSCRVILSGSAAEYGNSPDGQSSSETNELKPLTDYGRAKCEQFDLAMRFASRGFDIVTARIFNTIGPLQPSHFFTANTFERLRQGERNLQIHSGNHVRDWVDVRDVADAILLLAKIKTAPRVANVCTGTPRTVEHVARMIADLTAVDITVTTAAVSRDVLWYSAGNPQRMFDLGWRPRHSLKQSLADQWKHSLESGPQPLSISTCK